jgi:surface protein
MESMCEGATAFNQDLGGWNTAATTNMNRMFFGATACRRDLCLWYTPDPRSVNEMFTGADCPTTADPGKGSYCFLCTNCYACCRS